MKKGNLFPIKIIQSILLCIIFVLTIVPGGLGYASSIQSNLNAQSSDSGFIRISNGYDNEDGRKSTIDFLKDYESESKLKSFYNDICNTDLKYIEFSENDLKYIGEFIGGINFTNLHDDKYINQEVNGRKETELRTFQLGKSACEYLEIENNLEQGRIFTDDEYEYKKDKSIPVVLGYNYKNLFKLGDTFKASFLGEVDLNLIVVGFLKENVEAELSSCVLDDSIIMPSLNINNNEEGNSIFNTLLYNLKCSGVIAYSSNEEYDNSLNIIKQLRDKNQLEWRIQERAENDFKDYPLNISDDTIDIIYYVALLVSIILTLIVYKLEILTYSSDVYAFTEKETLLYQMKKSSVLGLKMIVINVITYNIILLFIINPTIKSTMFRYDKYMSGFYVLGFIFVNYLIVKHIKKLKHIKKES